MSSDRSQGPSGRLPHDGRLTGADRLADVLARAVGGPGPTPVELAEALWLAQHVAGPDDFRPPPPRPSRRFTSAPAPDGPDTERPPPRESPRHAAFAVPEFPGDRVPLRLPGKKKDPVREGMELLAPGPPMLTHPLALQRALRPVKRRVDAPVGHELDEEETAQRIARLGTWWLPVMRPAAERWLTLRLVHDTGPTMPVWRPLIHELHTALAQSGVFRMVELHRLSADGTAGAAGSRSYTAGRTVTLLVSDCMGPQWREGAAGDRWYRTLRSWAARMPVAVLQPLPERLWRTTALPALTARISAPGRVAPNTRYTVHSYAADGLAHDVLPVPVLEPSAPWLSAWARLVSGVVEEELLGSVALLPGEPSPASVDDEGGTDEAHVSAQELVLRFRSLASPEAFRLAGHVAVGEPVLPVMRLLQAAIEPWPQPQHLAEVILSGLLLTVPGPPGSYAFRPGVREVLLGTLPRTAHDRTAQLLSWTGALIDGRAGVARGEFPVVAPGGGDSPAGSDPFARAREESVRRMGGDAPSDSARLILGRYRLGRRLGRGRGDAAWQAEDTRSGRPVALHAYSFERSEDGRRLMDEARALCAVRHPNVVAVLDHGIDDRFACVVTEFTEGLSVAELTADGAFALPFALLAPLAQQVALGLRAVHEHGLAHGRPAADAVLVCPDGTVKITDFVLGTERPRDAARDLRRFGHLISDLARGPYGDLTRIPSEFRALFHDAVTPLTSSNPAAQRRGRDLFLTPSFGQALEAAAAERYRYRLLGPLRISQKNRALPVGSPQEQALLCMLLLAHGRPVPYSELAEGLWGEDAPQNADRLLADQATGLRETLGPGLLATTAGGYALYTGPDAVDVGRFESLVADSVEHRHAGDRVAARAALHSALALWTGYPVEGVPGPAARRTRNRLRALRLDLRRAGAELDLELGQFERAAADLGDLLRSHPSHAALRELHMLALRGLGRASEAVASYEAFTRYGEPSPAMLRLYGELRAGAGDGDHVVIDVRYPQGTPGATRDAVSGTLTRLLAGGESAAVSLAQRVREDCSLVLPVSTRPALTLLSLVLNELPSALLELANPPTIRATFWHTVPPEEVRGLPDPDDETVLVVLSPEFHGRLAGDSSGPDPARFSLGDPPDAWYCPLGRRTAPPPSEPGRDLVRGPFTTRDLRSLRTADPRSSAIVHTLPPDDSLTLLNPGRPLGKRTSWPLITYYEVALTSQRLVRDLSLPSSGGGTFAATAALIWHIDDPVAFVRAAAPEVQERLFAHLVEEGGRITRRYPLRRATAAEQALRQGLHTWPVPGLSVTCEVRLTPDEKPSSAARARQATTKRRGRRAP
ncbi:SAV_2336 N-terminal domain-related protein [Streptomyces griseorubiginosus]|uniref:SAV_2336 N-terminal domain-related protein n=1 Tax=Streptomyces griseorubiginosus TaxID=67304 RepID=UPI0036E24F02